MVWFCGKKLDCSFGLPVAENVRVKFVKYKYLNKIIIIALQSVDSSSFALENGGSAIF